MTLNFLIQSQFEFPTKHDCHNELPRRKRRGIRPVADEKDGHSPVCFSIRNPQFEIRNFFCDLRSS
jgi:hypothetical protein